MTPLRSLRSRLILGALLWTAGLLGLAHILSMTLMSHFPIVLRISHETLVIVGVLLIVAGLTQVRGGMSAVDRLRAQLSAVREGRDQRVEGSFPAEVQPLVDDLNVLLEHRERVVRRAQSKAGDLAHGLKTPLAVLAQEAERAEAAGQHELAATMGQQVERMRRQIEYHLAQARATASGATPGARCPVLASVEGLVRALNRLHAARGIQIQVQVSPDHAVRGQGEDLEEMLGNLLDNACKWAKSRVVVRSSVEGASVVITIDDDGPGLDASMHEAVLRRGVRADEAAPGSGLGLAIVRDLAELYGGSILLGSAPEGGLRAELRLPAC